MDGGRKTHLMMFFLDSNCQDCRRKSATLSFELAQELQKSKCMTETSQSVTELNKDDPQVVRVDCSKNKFVCRIFADGDTK